MLKVYSFEHKHDLCLNGKLDRRIKFSDCVSLMFGSDEGDEDEDAGTRSLSADPVVQEYHELLGDSTEASETQNDNSKSKDDASLDEEFAKTFDWLTDLPTPPKMTPGHAFNNAIKPNKNQVKGWTGAKRTSLSQNGPNACFSVYGKDSESTCKTCDAKDPKLCGSCFQGMVMNKNGEGCRCMKGKFWDQIGMKCKHDCMNTKKYPMPCSACDESAPQACSACQENASLDYGQCRCNKGFKLSANKRECLAESLPEKMMESISDNLSAVKNAILNTFKKEDIALAAEEMGMDNMALDDLFNDDLYDGAASQFFEVTEKEVKKDDGPKVEGVYGFGPESNILDESENVVAQLKDHYRENGELGGITIPEGTKIEGSEVTEEELLGAFFQFISVHRVMD